MRMVQVHGGKEAWLAQGAMLAKQLLDRLYRTHVAGPHVGKRSMTNLVGTGSTEEPSWGFPSRL